MSDQQNVTPRPMWFRALLSRFGEEEHSPFWKSQYNGVVKVRGRDLVFKAMIAAGWMTFLPMVIHHLFWGEPRLGVLLFLFGVAVTIECLAMLKRGRGVFGYVLLGFLLSCITISSVWVMGVYASYWVFPIVTLLVFFAPPKVSAPTNLFIILGSAVAAWQQMDPSMAFRMVAAVTIVALVAHFVMSAILRLHSELLFISTRDSLTKALNRSQLDDQLIYCLNDRRNHPASIALLDIDRFKSINDTYGHDVGDRVIIKLVECIAHHTRKSDLLFRVGGDEFLILFNDTKLAEAVIVVEKLRTAVLGQELVPGVKITLSIGLQVAHDSISPKQWIQEADRALYRAKEEGRNRVVVAERQPSPIPPVDFRAEKRD